jgi:hypothetical protein
MSSSIYNISPIRFRLPERNGGVITNNDMFPGMNYYTRSNDVILKNGYSSVFSTNFNIYSSAIAPKLVQYIPSLDIFSFTFYKGLYIYNPSIKNDFLEFETERLNIAFSITGGATFTLGDLSTSDTSESSTSPVSTNVLFYEGSYYRNDLADPFSFNGQNRTSANNNIKISMSPEFSKNRQLTYFELDGTSQVQNLASRKYVAGNEGILIPSLLPGDYFGIYLKFDVMFSIDSKPVDYAFFNVSYENNNEYSYIENDLLISTDINSPFAARDFIPGNSLKNSFNQRFFIQSFALKFKTNFVEFKNLLQKSIDRLYDNYPPFFSDYRESDDL